MPTTQQFVRTACAARASLSAGNARLRTLLHEIPQRLAGAAVISATQPVPENYPRYADPAVPVPVVLFHGTRDRLVPYQGGMASLRDCSRAAGLDSSAVRKPAGPGARHHRNPSLAPAAEDRGKGVRAFAVLARASARVAAPSTAEADAAGLTAGPGMRARTRASAT